VGREEIRWREKMREIVIRWFKKSCEGSLQITWKK
jgi:hypothetical protein